MKADFKVVLILTPSFFEINKQIKVWLLSVASDIPRHCLVSRSISMAHNIYWVCRGFTFFPTTKLHKSTFLHMTNWNNHIKMKRQGNKYWYLYLHSRRGPWQRILLNVYNLIRNDILWERAGFTYIRTRLISNQEPPNMT